MKKKATKKLKPAVWVSQEEVERLKIRARLKRQTRQNKEIRDLTRRLDRLTRAVDYDLSDLMRSIATRFRYELVRVEEKATVNG